MDIEEIITVKNASEISSKMELVDENKIKVTKTISEECQNQINKEAELYNKLRFLRDNIISNGALGAAAENYWYLDFSDKIGIYHSDRMGTDYRIIVFCDEASNKEVQLYNKKNSTYNMLELELTQNSCINAFSKNRKGQRLETYKEISYIVDRILENEQDRDTEN